MPDYRNPLSAYSALGAPWTSLLLTNTTGTPLRVVSPYHGIELGVFDKNALAPYIDKVWSGGTPIKMTAACGQDGGKIHTLIGQGSNGVLVFSENGVAKFAFPKPSTFTVYTNQITADPTPPDELTQCLSRRVASELGGALVRTVVLVDPDLDNCAVDQFYKSDPVQKYAQFFHQFGINNLAYAFGYDDTCDQSSFITVDDPMAVHVWNSGSQ